MEALKFDFRRRIMKSFLKIVYKMSLTTHVIAGVALAFMMVATFTDIILRYFGKPIAGSWEIISACGGLVIGFAIPYTSWKRGHIYVDALVNKLPSGQRRIVNITTRSLGILIFLFIGWNFFEMGSDLYQTNTTSWTLRIPHYPIAYGLGVACFLQSLLLASDILKIIGGEYE